MPKDQPSNHIKNHLALQGFLREKTKVRRVPQDLYEVPMKNIYELFQIANTLPERGGCSRMFFISSLLLYRSLLPNTNQPPRTLLPPLPPVESTQAPPPVLAAAAPLRPGGSSARPKASVFADAVRRWSPRSVGGWFLLSQPRHKRPRLVRAKSSNDLKL